VTATDPYGGATIGEGGTLGGLPGQVFAPIQGGLPGGAGLEWWALAFQHAQEAGRQALAEAEASGYFDGVPTLQRQQMEAQILAEAASQELQRRQLDETTRQADLDEAFRRTQLAEQIRGTAVEEIRLQQQVEAAIRQGDEALRLQLLQQMADLEVRTRELDQQAEQYGMDFAERQRQFTQTLAENARQYNLDEAFRRTQLAEQSGQFYAQMQQQGSQFQQTMGLEQSRLAEEARQADLQIQQAQAELQEAIRSGDLNRQQQAQQHLADLQFQRDQLAQQASQFGQTFGLEQQRLTEQARQFDRDIAQQQAELQAAVRDQDLNRQQQAQQHLDELQFQRDQLTEQARQFGLDLSQQESEFSRQFGLEQAKFGAEQERLAFEQASNPAMSFQNELMRGSGAPVYGEQGYGVYGSGAFSPFALPSQTGAPSPAGSPAYAAVAPDYSGPRNTTENGVQYDAQGVAWWGLDTTGGYVYNVPEGRQVRIGGPNGSLYTVGPGGKLIEGGLSAPAPQQPASALTNFIQSMAQQAAPGAQQTSGTSGATGTATATAGGEPTVRTPGFLQAFREGGQQSSAGAVGAPNATLPASQAALTEADFRLQNQAASNRLNPTQQMVLDSFGRAGGVSSEMQEWWRKLGQPQQGSVTPTYQMA
jgi:hypothetical protein